MSWGDEGIRYWVVILDSHGQAQALECETRTDAEESAAMLRPMHPGRLVVSVVGGCASVAIRAAKGVRVSCASCGEYLARIEGLLRLTGDTGTCRGCGKPIYWVKWRNGKRHPYTVAGVSHFSDCPNAGQFRK